ncbi:MAG: 16S rRNA (cytidine(1402)-2'-O)-methyltransferase [Erysipelotrichaceae bacterium]|nr:16S rRNA (cytidine(1402)-2'-O)-methyltransferase [Erysipelotrichaceae bacterium]MDY5251827.1 16S rRNA (cytidine(1402)-2'-O)-methyltransferase [Erysipelotrichaceae bacterium]
MDRQKSFENQRPTLYLVPTPIGNLQEMTPRSIDILKTVDYIACEDTRTSKPLLQHFGITTKTLAYHNFNEEQSCKGIIKLLAEGHDIALISDAGYPLISDPGQVLVNEVSKQGYNVTPLSGCNAMLNALVASGLIVQPFTFIGFLDSSTSQREKQLMQYREWPMTMIFYEAPHRINKTLDSMLKVLGDRKCCLARELTKKHEEFIRGQLSELVTLEGLKGEMVIVVEGKQEDKQIDDEKIIAMLEEAIAKGSSKKDAIKAISTQLAISKNYVYDLANKL